MKTNNKQTLKELKDIQKQNQKRHLDEKNPYYLGNKKKVDEEKQLFDYMPKFNSQIFSKNQNNNLIVAINNTIENSKIEQKSMIMENQQLSLIKKPQMQKKRVQYKHNSQQRYDNKILNESIVGNMNQSINNSYIKYNQKIRNFQSPMYNLPTYEIMNSSTYQQKGKSTDFLNQSILKKKNLNQPKNEYNLFNQTVSQDLKIQTTQYFSSEQLQQNNEFQKSFMFMKNDSPKRQSSNQKTQLNFDNTQTNFINKFNEKFETHTKIDNNTSMFQDTSKFQTNSIFKPQNMKRPTYLNTTAQFQINKSSLTNNDFRKQASPPKVSSTSNNFDIVDAKKKQKCSVLDIEIQRAQYKLIQNQSKSLIDDHLRELDENTLQLTDQSKEQIIDETKDNELTKVQFINIKQSNKNLSQTKEISVLDELQNTKNDLHQKTFTQILNEQFDEIQKREFMQQKKKASAHLQVKNNEVSQMKNGEEAIQYFAQYGDQAIVKFIYCKQYEYDPKKPFRPYDLEILDSKAALKLDQYYMISALGVANLYSKKMQNDVNNLANFISLKQWMSESLAYNVVQQIHFFKIFVLIKTFKCWKNNTSLKIYDKKRLQLYNKCLWSNNFFSKNLKQIQFLSFRIEEILLVNPGLINQKKSFELDDFLKMIAKHQDEIILNYSTNFDLVFEMIMKTINNVRKSFVPLKDFQMNENFQTKSVPLYYMKQQKELFKINKQIYLRNDALINKFIRLIDLIFIQAQLKNLMVSLIQFQNELSAQIRQKFGYIKQQVNFGENGLTFYPSFDRIFNNINDFIKQMINFPARSLRLQNKQEFSNYVKYQIDYNLLELIQKSFQYQYLNDLIQDQIKNDFQEAQNQVNNNFEKCRIINDDFETWSRRKDDIDFSNFDYEAIKNIINQVKLWQDQIVKFLRDFQKGIVSIQASNIKTKLQNHLVLKLDFLKVKSYQELRAKTQILYDELDGHYKNLEDAPKKFQQYGKYLKNQKLAKEQLPYLTNQSVQISQIQFLISQLDSSYLKQIDALQYQSILSNISYLKNKIFEIEKQIYDNRIQYTDKYQSSIEELQKEIKDINNIISQEPFIFNSEVPSLAIAMKDYNQIKQQIDDQQKLIEKLKNQQNNLDQIQNLMNLPFINNIDIVECEEKFNFMKLLWTNIKSYQTQQYNWLNKPFLQQNVQEIETQMRLFENSNVQLKIRENEQKTNDNLLNFFIEEVKQFQENMPVISALGNEDLRENHWKTIFEKLNQNNATKTFTFTDLLGMDVLNKKDIIEEISQNASGEAMIQFQLDNIIKKWSELCFVVIPFNDSIDKFKITGIDEIISALEDHQQSILTMMGTPYVNHIKSQIEEWEKRLILISEIIDEWLACQRNWQYLESIFNSSEIQQQLPQETQKFQIVDQFWTDIMNKANKNPLVLSLCNQDDLLIRFQTHNKTLEEIQKCLQFYLETKRRAFPRFYFNTNDELIQILSQARNPHLIQPYLRQCFDNINKIIFSTQDPREVLSMISADPEQMPEKVDFQNSVNIQQGENVESWLMKILKEMVNCLQYHTKNCLENYKDDFESMKVWLFENYPSQSILLVEMIQWQQNITNSIQDSVNDSDSLKKQQQFYSEKINMLVQIVRGELNILQRTLICTLLLINVHLRDIIENLVFMNVNKLEDFEWIKQLKYYWNIENDNCLIKQTNSSFNYSYEYLGNGNRLVITNLTDKVYLTMTCALKLNYGGMTSGPAGTGKTETIRDLSKALAIQCVVFNCSSSLDYRTFNRFFNGLAQCGAWCCFDEFNRINIEVLSVIAQQVQTIQFNLQANNQQFIFDGVKIPLDNRIGVFVTMNPKYEGRNELPDNLKALFRPISMMVPDYDLIAEIIFLSDGFQNAKLLSKKLVQLQKLASEQLSKQKHYDFGMRQLKSILTLSGIQRRQYVDYDEITILIQAIQDSNLPKFLDQDISIFKSIIVDLFPNQKVPERNYEQFQIFVDQTMKKKNLCQKKKLVSKMFQLYETLKMRYGVMVVGQNGNGKSTIINTISKAINMIYKQNKENGEFDENYRQVKEYKVNPKSISINYLYGYINLLTNEWNDGIASKIIRDSAEEPPEDQQWLIFDGPVDTLWVENLNTVFDENKTLCLSNGQRIKISQNFKILFEVNDLNHASPATVSRCGMLYIDNNQLGWKPLIKSWYKSFYDANIKESAPDIKTSEKIQSQENAFKQIVRNFYTKLIDFFKENIDIMLKKYQDYIEQSKSNRVKSCITLLNSCYTTLLENYGGLEKFAAAQSMEQEIYFNMILVFSIIWSMGTNYQDTGGKQTMSKISQMIKSKILKIYISFPLEGDIYDYFIDFKSKRFRDWNDLITPFKYDPTIPYFQIMVPTSDTVKFAYLIDFLFQRGEHTLLIGDSGMGKTIIVQHYISQINQQKFYASTINFSAQSSTQNLMDFFQDKDKFQRKKKDLSSPLNGKKMLIFLDDINMPTPEQYGAQPPIELLRQLIDQGGIYDLKKLLFVNYTDISYICLCAAPGGGRHPVTPRFFRHFNMFQIQELSKQTQEHIYTQIFKGYIGETNTENYASLIQPIVQSSVSIGIQIGLDLLPTPQKCHYTFNPRDLSKVFQGIILADINTIVDQEYMIQLWIHEMMRIFYDRLIDNSDREYFLKQIINKLETDLKLDYTNESILSIKFGDFLNKQKDYILIKNSEQDIIQSLTDNLTIFNMNQIKQTSLIFFQDAIDHIIKLNRVLKIQRGNALLIGLGGSGRQSLAKLSAYIKGLQVFQIQITKTYKEQSWKDDIKKILKQTGSKLIPSVFLISDTQVIKENYLEDISNILNSGEVQNLMSTEDNEEIISDLKQVCKERGHVESRENIFGLFIKFVRENLHIIMAFSPVGSKLRQRVRQYPSIINCCATIYFDQWPNDALNSIALKDIVTVDNPNVQQFKLVLSRLFVEINSEALKAQEEIYQQIKRRIYITPSNFLEFVKEFVHLFKQLIKVLPLKIKKYSVGQQTLQSTQATVDLLQQRIQDYQPTLIERHAQNDIIRKQLETQTLIAVQTEEKVQKETDQVNILRTQISKERISCQQEYDEALPVLLKAQEAVANIDKTQLQIIKSYNNPPPLVQKTLQSCCLLFGYEETWENAKRYLLNDIKFQQKLIDFDVNSTPDSKFKKLRDHYLNDTKFNKDGVSNQSQAAGAIYEWMTALNIYQQVWKDVHPKEVKLKDAQEQLQKVELSLSEKQEQLEKLKQEVFTLKMSFKESDLQGQNLQKQIDTAELQLQRATKLLSSLEQEQYRWQLMHDQFQESLNNSIGNVLLSAAFLAYLGPFNQINRQHYQKKWLNSCILKNIPIDRDFNIEKILSNDNQIQEWQSQDLPADKHSTENAILIWTSLKCPLIVDPQNQATKWIKKIYQGSGALKVSNFQDPRFFRILENTIKFGQPFLCENVEEDLDPLIEPILSKNLIKKGSQNYLKLGDQEIQYSNDFRFLMACKLYNPHFLPEVTINVTVVNFSVTKEGLDDQLLVEVVKFERNDLEKQRVQLIKEVINFKLENQGQQKLIRNGRQDLDVNWRIIRCCFSIQVQFKESDALVITLDQKESLNEDINQREKSSQDVRMLIHKTRENYNLVAKRGSVLFFATQTLSQIDPMYQWSLEYFLKIFKQILSNAEKNQIIEERVQTLLNDITFKIYKNISQGLFSKDKILFSFLITSQIQIVENIIDKDQWNFFLTNNENMDNNTVFSIEAPGYIKNQEWNMIVKFMGQDPFLMEFINSFQTYQNFWEQVIESNNPYEVEWPKEIKISEFQRLTLIKILRPENLNQGIVQYCKNCLGNEIIDCIDLSLSVSFKNSSCYIPIIFILSQGSDPMLMFQNFCQQYEYSEKLKIEILSLGQGQGEKAKRMIEKGREQGSWVFLQNCHLAISCLEILEKIQDNQLQDNCHPEFRLWLTSMPTTEFPINILANGIKITSENPKSLKDNLHQIYQEFKEDDYNDESLQYKKIVYSLSFFHSIIQERKKFGAIGWNEPYDWMISDLNTSIQQIKMNLADQGEIQFGALNFIISVINYGGRITDQKDYNVIESLIQDYINQDLLKDDFRLTEDDNYQMPQNFELEAVKQMIQQMPVIEYAEIFGLHFNANIILNKKEAKNFLTSIQLLFPIAKRITNKDENDQALIKLLFTIQSSIIQNDINIKVTQKMTSMDIFKNQELERFNTLLKIIQNTIEDLKQAMNGAIVMTQQLEDIQFSFLENRLPKLWKQYSYLSNKALGAWIEDFKVRQDFFKSWNFKGNLKHYLFSAFFFPQGFLTVLKQNYARAKQIPIDNLVFNFRYHGDEIKKDKNTFGSIINGLFLDGCGYDSELNQLQESVKKELIFQLGYMEFIFIFLELYLLILKNTILNLFINVLFTNHKQEWENQIQQARVLIILWILI